MGLCTTAQLRQFQARAKASSASTKSSAKSSLRNVAAVVQSSCRPAAAIPSRTVTRYSKSVAAAVAAAFAVSPLLLLLDDDDTTVLGDSVRRRVVVGAVNKGTKADTETSTQNTVNTKNWKKHFRSRGAAAVPPRRNSIIKVARFVAAAAAGSVESYYVLYFPVAPHQSIDFRLYRYAVKPATDTIEATVQTCERSLRSNINKSKSMSTCLRMVCVHCFRCKCAFSRFLCFNKLLQQLRTTIRTYRSVCISEVVRIVRISTETEV